MTTKTEKAATDPAVDEPAAAEPAPGWSPKVGELVKGGGRYGFVVDLGREPDTDKKESPEPVVLWLEGAAPSPFGGELLPAS